MTEYGHVADDGTITLTPPPDTLETEDGVVTGLSGANAETLAEYGYFPIVRTYADVTDQQKHEPTPVTSFDGSTITAHHAAIPKTDEELANEELRRRATAELENNKLRLEQIPAALTRAEAVATATITNVAQAQGAIRESGALLVNVINIFDGILPQLNYLLRQVLGDIDDTDDVDGVD